MNNLQTIKEQELLGKEFKVYGTLENPLFLARDVAEWIDYSKTSEGYYNTSKMLMSIDEDEKVTITNSNSGGNKLFLTEDGLYEVLMQSRKQIAKQFKKEVKKILKEIRKTGGYIHSTNDMSDDEIMARALQVARKTIEKKSREIEEKDKVIQLQQPKVLFADSVASSDNSILVGELAKLLRQNGIDTGQNRLFDWLRNNGYLIKRKGEDYNTPTQKSVDLGVIEIKEGTRVHPDGHTSITKTPKITGKGQIYFINKFKKNNQLSMLS
ncbi:TPA: phage antirepressor [Clostridioides difficile]|uniref:phage antirepressor n=1 Tax=Clostridioides difficile TaxID=1496 RepID=UPI001033E773|nr:phage antirepressor KilAC domain-containing protein [Clostridioides difficile]HBF5483987.1 phage antirepressor KilAC domain-containing protein [Clostridioides difficile]HBF5508721.1 phage antirepressor KilAC domain-containing protein [Clostridioides difficile]HBF5618690.1 phage antirepressor KilAC domain-containing protein [Clostridioides difficile]HBF5661074.1 phage antirepressor KilAC domain-containing protein [Clostridioides difficile]HBH3114409.1 phage antirepressor KilAC domain-contain